MMMKSHLNPLIASTALVALLGAGLPTGASATAPKPKRKPVAVRHAAPAPKLPMLRFAPPVGQSFAAAAVAPAASVTRPASDVVLSIGRGQLVTLPGVMKDVFVAEEKVADVQVKANNQLYIFGRSAGETTIYASNAAGAVIWSANVRVANNIDSVDQMLKVAMPDSRISVATVGANTLLLTGTVHAPEDAAEAERLVKAYTGKDANIITRLKTATPLQVNLQVRIAEVSRSLSKTLNSNLSTSNSADGFKYAVGQGRTIGGGAGGIFYPDAALGVGNTPYKYIPIAANATAANPQGLTQVAGSTVNLVNTASTIAAQLNIGKLSVLGALDAGETAGLVTTLAQPNLTALSGETGEFLAGGEFPIPISSGLGAVSIEYKKYGVSLSFTSTVLADGRISLRVRPEVSELSSQGSVTLNGFSVPALTMRRAETSVELGSGQSMMLGGLLSNSANNTITKLPGAGDIPILGNLFKSSAFRRGETELVIVVTPYLVKPVNDGDIKLPTDGMQNPNDLQRWWGNQMSDGISGAKRPAPSAAPNEAAPNETGKRNSAAAEPAKSAGSTPGFSLN